MYLSLSSAKSPLFSLWRVFFLLALVLLNACGQGTPGYQESANAKLIDLQLRNTVGQPHFDRNFNPDINHYRVTVDSAQDELDLVVATEDLDATASINGQPNMVNKLFRIKLEFGENKPIEIVVTAADGVTQRVYTVTFLRPDNSIARLLDLKLATGQTSAALSPNFHPDVFNYKSTVPYGQDSISVQFDTDENSVVTVDDEPVEAGKLSPSESLQVGSNYILIKVMAQDGVSSHTYRIEVIRESSNVTKQNDKLQSLELVGAELDQLFQPLLSTYSITVENKVQTLTVKPLAQNENATVTVIYSEDSQHGTVNVEQHVDVGEVAVVPLFVGKGTISIKVASEIGGFERVYAIDYTRQPRTESRLQRLTLIIEGEGERAFGFSSDKDFYGTQEKPINVANGATFVTFIPEPVDEAAIVEVDNSVVPSGSMHSVSLPEVGIHEVKISVTAQDRATKSTYTMVLNRVSSTDVDLKELNLPVELGFQFESAKTEYTLQVPYERGSLMLNATPNDETSTMKINGDSVSSGEDRNHSLQVGQNVIDIVVTGKYGFNTKLYRLIIERDGSDKAELLNLGLDIPNSNLEFLPGKLDYSVAVANAQSEVLITPEPVENGKVVVKLNGVEQSSTEQDWLLPLAVGVNQVELHVTSQNETNNRIYTLKLTRAGSDNANLATLTPSFGAFEPAFDRNTTSYNATVASSVASFTLQAQPEQAQAAIHLVVDGQTRALGDTLNLASGVNNAVQVVVTAENGSTQKSYWLNVARQPSGNAQLSALSIVSGSVLKPSFASDVYDYSLNVDSTTSNVQIQLTTASPGAKLFVNNNLVATESGSATVTSASLSVGNNSVSIRVESEDGLNQQLYSLTVNKATSTNADLNGLILSTGSLSPSFNSDILDYGVTVVNEVAALQLKPNAAHGQANIQVNGKTVASGFFSQDLPLVVGSNTVTVKVTAEAGNSQEYILTVNREQSSNANLADLISPEGSFSRFDNSFTMTVANDYASFRLTPTLENGAARVYLSDGQQLSSSETSLPLTLNVGTQVFYLTVEAQDGTQKTYSVAVTRLPSSNANLLSLTPSQGSLSPAFSPDQLNYSLTVNHEVEQLTLSPLVAQNAAWVKVDGVHVQSGQPSQALGLGVGENPFAVVVTAEDGSIQNYNVTVVRQQSDNANLANIGLSRGSLDSTFSPSKLGYVVNVGNEVTSLTVTPTLAQADASMKINNEAASSKLFTLPVGNTSISIQVVAQNGIATKTYSLTVNRAPSSNAKLQSLSLNSGGLSPLFDPNTSNYNAVVPNDVASVTVTAVPQAGTATMVLNGNVLQSNVPSGAIDLFVGSPQQIAVEVSAEDGTQKIYTVNVTRQQSAVANLSSLVPSVGTLSPVFSQTTTDYVLNVVHETDSVSLTPTTLDITASIEVNGVTVASGSPSQAIAIAVGNSNYINVRVTAQNGSTAMDYVVNVVREGSSNADLAGLSVDNGFLNPSFDSLQTNYTMELANNVDSLTLTPQVADANAKVKINTIAVSSGVGHNVPLTVGVNDIDVEVQAQNGNLKTYHIATTRLPSSNASLSALTVSAGNLSPMFSSLTTSYNVSLDNSISSFSLTPTVADNTASIKVNGVSVNSGAPITPASLPVGNSNFTIAVTAEDGTIKTYNVTVNRAASANADLGSLQVLGASVTPSFAANTLNYSGVVTNDVTSVQLLPTVADSTATLKLNNVAITSGQITSPIALNVGLNDLVVDVTAENGSIRTYTVSITRQQSSMANLAALQPSVGNLSPVFSATTTNYTVNVANGINTIQLTPTVQDSNSSVTVNGVAVVSGQPSQSLSLQTGDNYFTVRVTAQNGSTFMDYVVNVVREGSSNADLNSLVLSNGSLNPVFAAAQTSYTASVENSVSSLGITSTVADSNATISVNNSQIASGATANVGLNVGDNTINVVVTAQNGAQRSYYVVVNRAPSSNADLSGLSLSDGSLSPAFSAGVINYNVSVGNGVEQISLTPTAAHSQATVQVNGQSVTSGQASQSYPVSVGSNNFVVVVTAEDGSTQKSYNVTVTRADVVAGDASLQDLRSSIGALDQVFNSNTLAYTQTVANSYTSVGITATVAQTGATVTINGQTVTSGFVHNVSLTVGENLFAIVVTAQDSTQKTYTLTVIREANNNADLSALQASIGLGATFDPNTLTYTNSTDYNTATVTIMATVADAGATLKINNLPADSGFSTQVPMNVGLNSIPVEVTAADGVTVKTYTLNFTRNEASSDATLQWLTISSGTLTPTFSPGTLSYSASVANSVSSINVAAAPNATVTSLKLNGSTMVAANQTPVALDVGSNVILVEVVAQDGVTTLTYQITVSREAAVVGNTMILHPSGIASNPGSYGVSGGTWATALDSNDGDSSYVERCCTGPTVKFWVDLDDPTGLEGATINSITFHAYVRNTSSNHDVNIGFRTDGSTTLWKGATAVAASSNYTLLSSAAYTSDSVGGSLDLTDLNNLQIALDRIGTGPSGLRVTEVYAVIDYTVAPSSGSTTVCSSGCDYTTIQAAINAATAGDTIEVYSGTYAENIDFSGKDVIVVSQNGAASTFITGSSSYNTNPVVSFSNGETSAAVLDGFTLDNQQATMTSRGVYVSGATPTIKNSVIENNTASNCGAVGACGGGGVYITNSVPTFDNVVIQNNTANNRHGGGVYITGVGGMNLINGSVVRLNGTGVNQGYGGGIYHAGSDVLTISDSTVESNSTVNRGGGIYLNSATANITGSIIRSNTLPGTEGGGGLYLAGTSNLTMSKTQVLGNSSNGTNNLNDGGGIKIEANATATISNSVIAGNSVYNAYQADGGAIYNLGTLNLYFSTITDNFTNWRGALYAGGTENIFSSIIWGNVTDHGTADIFDTVENLHLTLTSSDPGFVQRATAASGAPTTTGNYQLSGASSPAVNAGDATNAPADDLLGATRPANGGYDQGAYEYVVVTNTTTVCSSGCDYSSLQTAINTEADGAVIEVQSGTYAETLEINGKSLTLVSAAGAASTTLTGNSGWPVLRVYGGGHLELDGFTIDNSTHSASGSRAIWVYGGASANISNVVATGNHILGFASDLGGAIFIEDAGTVNLENINVTGNSSKYGGGGVAVRNSTVNFSGKINIDNNTVSQGPGGGIYAYNSHITINGSGVGDSSISGNVPSYVGGHGGGIFFNGIDGGSLSIRNISIDDNRNINAKGGGVTLLNVSTPVVIEQVSISGNATKSGGGAIYADNTSVQISNATMDNNSASQGAGGGVYIFDGGSATITDSSISGNSASYGGKGLFFDGLAADGSSSTGSLSIFGSTIDNNFNNASGSGGGINIKDAASIVNISNTNVRGNTAKSGGGGIYVNNSVLNLVGSNIENNTLTQGSGAGLFFNTAGSTVTDSVINGNSCSSCSGGGIYSTGSMTIDKSTISGNASSGDGGGLYTNAEMSMSNTVVSGNVTTTNVCCGRDGGGMWLGGTVTHTLSHVTVVGNGSYDFAGVFSNAGVTNIENSILWGNYAYQGTGDLADNQLNQGGTVTLSNSVIEDGWSGNGSNNSSAEPVFVDYQTASASSPNAAGDFRICSDAATPVAECPAAAVYPSAGIDLAPAASTPSSEDRVGNPRPADVLGVGNDGSNTYDAGAYEVVSGDANFVLFQSLTANKESATSIAVSAEFIGDANANGTVTVEYKLSSATTWSNWLNDVAAGTSPYQTFITGLQLGQSYDVRVTFSDFDGVSGTNPQIIEQVSADADLASLYLGGGVSYTPTFDPAVTNYAAVLGNDISVLPVTATLSDSNASFTIASQPATSGVAQDVSLQVGDNLIPIVVTAVDGNTKQYNVSVYRPNDSADLISLQLSTGSYTPAFDPAVTSYNQSVNLMMNSSVTVTPTAAGLVNSITVNGNLVASGETSQAIPLSSGSNTISIVVEAQSGSFKTYNVFINAN